ncbi:MAG: hypothetical protein A3C06_00285 [Candidatus Taylorbacteria bacterium RIFCSPHIGHO2_02_FULL_46_13]|uniref:Uncharacterized protein n=1 Tax=Candidatus Taylorbacteria bacterium RIFCSPHIGHO2_02_FULL_46_13 TaxID=1802312 RepID=A0A1G2MWW2_9BACT|nr:MAG: hypothetical protein A3C06_00285 [Candidatus Taylorbacteria bacterium RIFCSPHIGHO2_02_FULL_46_13]
MTFTAKIIFLNWWRNAKLSLTSVALHSRNRPIILPPKKPAVQNPLLGTFVVPPRITAVKTEERPAENYAEIEKRKQVGVKKCE